MFQVKNQDDYNALKWEEKLHYNEQNRNNPYAEAERKRTEQILYANPTDAARNWWAQQAAVASGVSAADAVSGSFDKGQYAWQQQPWVRQVLNDYGIKNDRIGFRSGNVTVDGRDFLTPEAVYDGKSYASRDTINKAFENYNDQNQVVAARSYINSVSPGTTVGWDGNTGQVMVDSVYLKPDYIVDGTAYISKDRVNQALAQSKAETGLYTPQEILDQSNDRWGSRIDRLYEMVENPEPFSWSAEKDEAYQDFQRVWREQSQKQYDDTLARLNTQSGGAPSLGAMAAAHNMMQDSIGQLDAYKQQFRNQAYQEYVDAYNRDLERLSAATGLRQDEFDRAYGVSRDSLGDAYTKRAWDEELKDNELNRRINEQTYQQSLLNFEQAKLELDNNRQLAPLELELMVQAVESGKLQLTALQNENLIRQYEMYMAGIGTGGNFNSSRSGGATPAVRQTEAPVDTSYTVSPLEPVQGVDEICAELFKTGGFKAVQEALKEAIETDSITQSLYMKLYNKYRDM